jgi:glycosyltransferase involved in cell wall biosynthesis
MNVLVYFNSMSAAGGIERVIVSHINYMSATCKICLLTKDSAQSFYKLPDSVIHESLNMDFNMNMKSRLSRIIKICTSLYKTIKSLKKQFNILKPNVLYVASPLNLLEVFLARKKGMKIIVTEHSAFSSYNFAYKLIIYFLYPRVDLLTVPTKTDSKSYLERGIGNSYVPNPLPFNPEIVSDLSIKRVLCVGRLTADKRHDLLLHIWHLSKIFSLGWKLLIIGKGECEFDLRNKINELDLNDSVFIEQPTIRIQDKYKSSSIFLLTSRSEGFGLVLIEAMAFGVPCISFDCPSGPRDIITNGLTGYLIEEGNVSCYADTLRLLAQNSSLRSQLGMNARNSISKFKTETVCKEFMRIFDEKLRSS